MSTQDRWRRLAEDAELARGELNLGRAVLERVAQTNSLGGLARARASLSCSSHRTTRRVWWGFWGQRGYTSLGRRNSGALDDWTTEALGHWSNGPLKHWGIGPLKHWGIGALEHWNTEALVHWSTGALVLQCPSATGALGSETMVLLSFSLAAIPCRMHRISFDLRS